MSDSTRWNFVYYICVAMVQMRRDEILKSEFSEIMEALQKQANIGGID